MGWYITRKVTRRIGLLGGSFNPAHAGHVALSVEALKRLGLDEVWWLVSPQNPLKSRVGMAALDERLQAAQCVASHPRIRVTDIESQLGTRYTVDTLQQLMRLYPDVAFVWLMGTDNLQQFPRWHRWREMMERVPVAVFDRGLNTHRVLRGKAARCYASSRVSESQLRRLADRQTPAWGYVFWRKHPLSATEIRKKLGISSKNRHNSK